MRSRVTVAYVIDPRFSGGTSSAIAQELRETSQIAKVSVYAIESRMFRGRQVAAQIEAALADLAIPLVWDATLISADVVILHNPIFLKFDPALATRIVARHLVVVTHENFLRPGGAEGFDIAHCFDVIDQASLAIARSIAPISSHNRRSVTDWLIGHPLPGWTVLADDWFNICEFPLLPATSAPRDRRGRHSRPGYEKFPALDVMDICFPRNALSNTLLGADNFMNDGLPHPHWTMHRYKSMDVAHYFEALDFMVYFTSPVWRESFGRVLAEGVAAGKVVISDPETAASFNGAVIPAAPQDVDGIIQALTTHPDRYRDQVALGQSKLSAFSGRAFRAFFDGLFAPRSDAAHDYR